MKIHENTLTVLQIGHIDLSFHRVAAAVVLAYFDQIGQAYQLHTAPHEQLFAMYRAGTLDMILGAWLPSSHGRYIEEVKDTTEKYATLYEPFCIWGVPDYIPEDEVETVADIGKHGIHHRFNKLIQGINEGAGISRFSRKIIQEYRLDTLGFKFANGSIADCTTAFIKAYQKKEWVIVPLWEPQYLLHSYTIRALKEPKGLLGTVDKSTIIVRKNTTDKFHPNALKFIKSIYFGNTTVTALDHHYQVEGMALKEVAKNYLTSMVNSMPTTPKASS